MFLDGKEKGFRKGSKYHYFKTVSNGTGEALQFVVVVVIFIVVSSAYEMYL